eukprot:9476581-Pyramimonas_sp.AAC.2
MLWGYGLWDMAAVARLCYAMYLCIVVFGGMGKYNRYEFGTPARWKALKLPDYLKTVGRVRVLPKFGVLELFAQSINIASLDASGLQKAFRLIVPPCVLKQANSSTVFRAFEQGFEPLNLTGISDISLKVGFVMISETPDNHRVNTRTHVVVVSPIIFSSVVVHVGVAVVVMCDMWTCGVTLRH